MAYRPMIQLSKALKCPPLRQCRRTAAISCLQRRYVNTPRIVASTSATSTDHIQSAPASTSLIHDTNALASPEPIQPPSVSQQHRLTLPPGTLDYIQQFKRDIIVEIDGDQYTYDAVFLRDLCPCPKCVDPSTQQKLFNTTDIPDDIVPKEMRIKDKGSLEIIWDYYPEGRTHVSYYDPDLLYRYSTPERRRHFRYPMPKQVYWDGEMMKENMLRADYKAFLDNDEMLHRVLVQLHKYGLAYFVNVPSVNTDGTEIAKLAERIGEAKQTFYGKTWDVKSVPQSKNIAYTNLNLGLHMDLMYYNSPPGLQFLHCMRNTVSGGSSIFVDSFRVATLLRLQSKQAFLTLTTSPVQFHYLNDNKHFYFSRPTVVLDPNDPQGSTIDHVNYAPPFQAPFEVETAGKNKSNWRRFVAAFKGFAEISEREDMRFEETLKEGECVVFANRRVLHARRAFDTDTGERWLKGAYVDWDDFQSKLRVSMDRFGTDHEMKRGIFQ